MQSSLDRGNNIQNAPALLFAAASALEAVCCAAWRAMPAPPAEVAAAIAGAMIQAKNLRSAVEEIVGADAAPCPADLPRLIDGEESID